MNRRGGVNFPIAGSGQQKARRLVSKRVYIYKRLLLFLLLRGGGLCVCAEIGLESVGWRRANKV